MAAIQQAARVLFLFALWGGVGIGSRLFPLDPAKAVTQYIHEVWTSDRGLPQDSIQCLIQSRDGYIWVGTQEGFSRFDGFRFWTYDKRNLKELHDKYIFALYEDRQGRLWIGTRGGGMNCFYQGKCIHFSQDDGLPSNFVYSFAEDDAGNLWIGTGAGVCLLREGKISHPEKSDGVPKGYVYQIVKDHNGSLWSATSQGLYCWQAGRFRSFTTRDGLSSTAIRAIVETKDNTLWVGTEKGLNHFVNGRWISYSTRDGLSNDSIYSLLQDRQGSLWIGTYGGGICRMTKGQFNAYSTREGLSNDFIQSILEDHEGSLWIGTFGGGLNRLKDGKITTYSTREGLSNNFVWSIREDHLGRLWIGTNGGGLNRLENGRFSSFTTRFGLAKDMIYSLYEDRSGTLWVGTFGGGVDRISNSITNFNSRRGLVNDFVQAICETRDGSIWFGTRGGLSRLRGGTFTNYTTKQGLSHNQVRVILEDSRGDLWIGTDAGLNRFRDSTFSCFTTKDGLANEFIYSLYEDDAGAMWIGTRGGLNRFQDGHFTAFTVAKGLFDDIVFQILEDDQENLWMSCNRGIFRVSKKELDQCASGKIEKITCSSYGKNDGMGSSECNGGAQPAGWKTRDGRLWFPTMKGVTVIDPAVNEKRNEKPPPVRIERFLADGQDVPLYLAKKITLLPGVRQFEFQYTALSFFDPGKNFFKYMLEGFDRGWNSVGTRRMAFYTNIPPGHYTFHVIACNNDQVWNAEGASLQFDLQPFFYQTKLFYVLVVLVIFFSGVALYVSRIHLLKKKQSELSSLVEERTRELQNSNRQLEAANQEIRRTNQALHEKSLQLEEANRMLERLSNLDSLTGLANRRYLEQFLNLEWRRASRESQPISLIMVDIDFFKLYNDCYGHQAGDECLKKVAAALCMINRPGDMVARYGGEEFLVVLANTGNDGAVNMAERMREKVSSLKIPHTASIVDVHLTISLGVSALVPERDSFFSEGILRADQALYRAKTEGRNRVCVFSSES